MSQLWPRKQRFFNFFRRIFGLPIPLPVVEK